MDNTMLKNYAELLVRKGVNMQKGQMLVINADVQNADFVKLVVDAGYANGASEVVVMWGCEYVRQQYYLNGEDFIFDEMPEWLQARFDYYYDRKACYIHILSDDPSLLKDVATDKISRDRVSSAKSTKRHHDRTMSNETRWTIGAVPSPAWATKVFPDIPVEEAIQKLWALIEKCSRLDGDPIKNWEEHNANFETRLNFMNGHKFKSLHYTNSLGTDLTVELPEGAIWYGGSESAKDGLQFFANIPTEEVFTLPRKNDVNGRLIASMPLVYTGNQIDGIEFTFKDGRIVSHTAKTNADLLAQLVDTDEGSHYLGEVALVPHRSPISETGILFYETLFDENASCHFAFGKAYPSCLEGSENMTEDELLAAGVNDSLTHIDFMVGTPDLNITGIDAQGNEVPIFVNGNFTF